MNAAHPAHPFRITKTLSGGSRGYGIYEVVVEDGQGGRKTHFELVGPGGEFIAPTHASKGAASAVMLARIAGLAAVFKREKVQGPPEDDDGDDSRLLPRP